MKDFYNSFDYLFILKENKIENTDEILKSYYVRNEEKYPFIEFTWEMEYSNEEIKICNDFYSKLQYMLASLYEDTYISDLVGGLIGIYDIRVMTSRFVNGNNLKLWQEKLGFSFDDFLMNKKYVVISDSKRGDLDEVITQGFFNWNDIEIAYGNRYTYKDGNFQEGIII